MTLAWMLYAVVVSALIGAAAWAAERGLRGLRRPTRWLWAAAFTASLLLPALIASVSIELPAGWSSTTSRGHPFALRQATSPALSPQAWVSAALAAKAENEPHAAPHKALSPIADRPIALLHIAPTPAALDALLQRAWALASAGMLLALAASAIVLWLRKRRWIGRTVAGKRVFVAPDAGPAVVGLLRPRIVLPAWLLAADAGQQTLVVAHEQSHIDARDPQLLTLALCLLVLMPWNLPLWWQLRRLRHAIEVDCDARVLGAGHDLQHYGAALIDVGQRQSAFLGAVAAMAESRSLLEQRIGLMVAPPRRWRKAGALALAAASLCALAVAAQVAPPSAAGQTPPKYMIPAERHQVNVKASRLVDYIGVYQLDEFELLTITPEGRRLWTRTNGRDRMEIYPERDDEFFSRDVNEQISFKRDARGRVTALVLHQMGADITAPLLEDDAAARAAAALERHIHRTTAMPGGEAAIRQFLSGPIAADMPLPALTPGFEVQLRGALQYAAGTDLTAPGKLKSIRFIGVDPNGFDEYELAREHAVQRWLLQVNSDGRVAWGTIKPFF